MYGMVMKSIEAFLRRERGESGWNAVAADNGLEYSTLVATESYPDGLTVGLVNSGATLLGLTPAEFMMRLGDFWIDFALETPMRELMINNGRDPGEFIAGMNLLHVRSQLLFARMEPPRIDAEREGENAMRIIYSSRRVGFEPFFEGTLAGIARMFGMDHTLERVPASRPDSSAEYRFTWTHRVE
ncbi:MAG: heme NO-binding domain-containing protein [Pseudomonadales bacterium]